MTQVLISGVCGQDGSLLAKFYLDKRCKVYGIKRRSSSSNIARVENLINHENFSLIEGDITDSVFINHVFNSVKPDLFFNMAAMSHVHTSFSIPAYTFQVNAVGVLLCLEAIRNYSPQTRMLQASTSEMMGDNFSVDDNGRKYQNENTPMSANSPYACAKLAAHHLVKLYREAYNIFACCAITFNHEQPGLRGKEFVTRKISLWIANFYKWMKKYNVDENSVMPAGDYIYLVNKNERYPCLRLGNLDAYRDWMCAEDAVRAFDIIINDSTPDDYVIATGETHTVREFCELAFKEIGINDFMQFVVIDPKFYRPMEVNYLCGDYTKIKNKLGWEPKVTFSELVKRMIRCDINNTGVV